jgi:hypothetical protein
MKNRELYSRDPFDLDLLNNGVAVVTDEQTEAELRTLGFELRTFVCDGEYARGMTRVLNAFLGHLDSPEQPGVWVSGFYGCGKSHFAKMLRALWVDYRFPDDGATATGLAHLPDEVSILLKELGTAGKRLGGLHAASGTLGAGANNNVRLALLNLVFRSVGLPGQYPLARFVMWLRDNGNLNEVRKTVEASGRVWEDELHDLYVSPVIAGAVHQAQPDLADSPKEVRQLLKAQYPNVDDVPVDEMVAAIKKALAPKGTFPLTLIAIDEVQQFIDEQSTRAYAIQEVTEACCKRFGGKLLFVATGQTALSGTPLLQKLLGRFPTSVELSDTDVETVIRKVILAKKPGCLKTIDDELLKDVGEISRHLQGTKLEHRDTDRETWVSDYPLLPVRRRFWERTLRAVDQAGTTGQLRNQLSVVHEATRATADRPLGSVVAADFIYDQQEAKLVQSGALPREIYEQVRTLRSGNEDDTFNARILGLVFLIGKLPREAGSDTGVRATPEMLADLLVEDLGAGSAPLRQRVPAALKQLEDAGLVMAVGDEYRLQTRESSAWNSEFRDQYNKVANDPQRLASERSDVLRKAAGDRLKLVKLAQGGSKEPRAITPHFGATTPPPDKRAITVWVRDGWDDDERSVEADARRPALKRQRSSCSCPSGRRMRCAERSPLSGRPRTPSQCGEFPRPPRARTPAGQCRPGAIRPRAISTVWWVTFCPAPGCSSVAARRSRAGASPRRYSPRPKVLSFGSIASSTSPTTRAGPRCSRGPARAVATPWRRSATRVTRPPIRCVRSCSPSSVPGRRAPRSAPSSTPLPTGGRVTPSMARSTRFSQPVICGLVMLLGTQRTPARWSAQSSPKRRSVWRARPSALPSESRSGSSCKVLASAFNPTRRSTLSRGCSRSFAPGPRALEANRRCRNDPRPPTSTTSSSRPETTCSLRCSTPATSSNERPPTGRPVPILQRPGAPVGRRLKVC